MKSVLTRVLALMMMVHYLELMNWSKMIAAWKQLDGKYRRVDSFSNETTIVFGFRFQDDCVESN